MVGPTAIKATPGADGSLSLQFVQVYADGSQVPQDAYISGYQASLVHAWLTTVLRQANATQSDVAAAWATFLTINNAPDPPSVPVPQTPIVVPSVVLG